MNVINIYLCSRVFDRVKWIYAATASNIFWVLYKVFHYTKMVGDDLSAKKVNYVMFLCPRHGGISSYIYIKTKEIRPHIQSLLLHKLGKYTVADCTVLTHLRTEAGFVRI